MWPCPIWPLRVRLREEMWTLPDGSEREIYFFDVCDPPVWGATARILKDLLHVVGADPSPK